MLSGDTPSNAEQKAFIGKALYCPSHGLDEIRKFYETLTANLIQKQSCKLRNGYQLDIVREFVPIPFSRSILTPLTEPL